MRPNNVTVLFLAIAMGSVAAFLAGNWIESHSRALAAGDSVGTIVVAAEPLGFGAEASPDSITATEDTLRMPALGAGPP